MESWRYSAEEKGFLFPDENDTDLSIDSFGRSRKLLTGWDVNSVESMEFVDLGFSEMPKKSSCGGDRSLEMLGSVEIGIDPSKLELTSPSFMIASNPSLESGVNRSDSHDSSLIDLKLGRLADANSKRPASQAKKGRGFGSRLQTPFCQVYGCQKDLSSLKDYHKRHKVCEVHSKTPRVIVNGLEQRFCQQCSRFHLLVEFDESKRSCRKRLAGHNERRRKPQFGGLSSRPYRLLQSYQGTEFLKASIQKKASMIFPHMLPGSILYPEKCEEANLSRPVKLEEKSIYCAGGQFLPKSFLNLHGNDIQNTSGRFPRAAEDFSVLNATSSIHDIAGVSHSSCARSLLSAESQDLSHSAGIIIGRPLTCQSINPHLTESSGKYSTNVFHSSGMNHFETDGFLPEHEANFLNAKYNVSAENGSTVSLLQLSSHLHRVEQQRNSAQVKHEIEDFSSFLPNYGT